MNVGPLSIYTCVSLINYRRSWRKFQSHGNYGSRPDPFRDSSIRLSAQNKSALLVWSAKHPEKKGETDLPLGGSSNLNNQQPCPTIRTSSTRMILASVCVCVCNLQQRPGKLLVLLSRKQRAEREKKNQPTFAECIGVVSANSLNRTLFGAANICIMHAASRTRFWTTDHTSPRSFFLLLYSSFLF